MNNGLWDKEPWYIAVLDFIAVFLPFLIYGIAIVGFLYFLVWHKEVFCR